MLHNRGGSDTGCRGRDRSSRSLSPSLSMLELQGFAQRVIPLQHASVCASRILPLRTLWLSNPSLLPAILSASCHGVSKTQRNSYDADVGEGVGGGGGGDTMISLLTAPAASPRSRPPSRCSVFIVRHQSEYALASASS